jgi:hypothetical protein
LRAPFPPAQAPRDASMPSRVGGTAVA